MAKLGIAVQLYTVRDLTASDFAGTMERLSDIGYRNVELAGFGNLSSAKEVRDALDANGMRAIGSHAGIEALEKDLGKVLDDNEAVGNRNIVVPWIAEERRKDAAGWKAFAKALDTIGAACKKRGFELAYHNHSFEYQKFDGKTGLDILFENTDPDLVKAELDIYWVQHGGEHPVSSIERLGKRVLLLHLKDMDAGPDKRFAPVGTGILPFAGILAAAGKVGAQWGVVEQDSTYDTPPLEALETSFKNLKKLNAFEEEEH